jgi:hypothetical protein
MSFASSNPFDALNDNEEDGWTAVTKKRTKRVKDVLDKETLIIEEEAKNPSLTIDESIQKFLNSFHHGHSSLDIRTVRPFLYRKYFFFLSDVYVIALSFFF